MFSRISAKLCVFAAALCAGTALAADGAKNGATIPNFAPAPTTAWSTNRPTMDDFIPPSSGPGPVMSDPAHPYVPNGNGRQPTYRIADLTNPILKPWVIEKMKKANDDVIAGKVPYIARERCWPAGVPALNIYTRGQPIYFIQTPKEVLIVNELNTQIRHVYLNVPQNYVPSVPPGTKATISVPEHPGKTYSGTVEASAQAVDPITGTTLMQLIVDNGAGELMPGDYASIHLQMAASPNVLSVPSSALIGGYYVQAINKQAPHPAAARLWEEFLYSDAGQNLWLKGGARPVRQAAMEKAGTVDTAAAAALPKVSGTPLFPTIDQQTAAGTYVSAHWSQAIG